MRQIDRIYIQTLFAIIGSLLFFWSAALLAGQITVAWDATPDPAVGGYKLYYRQIGQNYSVVDVGYQTTFTLFGLENGKVFCIAAAAYNIARTFESGLSNEACKQLPPAFQDMNGDGTADLAGLSSAGQIFYTLDRRTWTNVPGQLSQLVVADLDGNGTADLAGLSSAGQIFYTLDRRTWTNIPGQLTRLVAADLDGNGAADLAGLNGAGQIFYTLDRRAWTNIPGQLTRLVAADLDGNGAADLAGLSSAGQIFYTTNRSTWANIPGWLDQIRIKDINGDGRADIIGLSVGSIYYTTNLSIWTNIPGQLIVLDSNL